MVTHHIPQLVEVPDVACEIKKSLNFEEQKFEFLRKIFEF